MSRCTDVTVRGAGRRKAQLATRERRLAQLKISDEEKHDSNERTSTIYCILINSTHYE